MTTGGLADGQRPSSSLSVFAVRSTTLINVTSRAISADRLSTLYELPSGPPSSPPDWYRLTYCSSRGIRPHTLPLRHRYSKRSLFAMLLVTARTIESLLSVSLFIFTICTSIYVIRFTCRFSIFLFFNFSFEITNALLRLSEMCYSLKI